MNPCCCLVNKFCRTLLQPYALQPARLLCLWDILGKITGVGCRFLLQDIFLTQGSNLCLLCWQEDLLEKGQLPTQLFMGFPGGSDSKEPTCQCRRCKKHGFNPWIRKVPWRRKWQSTPLFLPGKYHGQRSLAGYSPGVTQNRTQLKRLSMHAQEQVYKNVRCFIFLN